MAQLNFDATQVEPDTGIDVVPAGWYNVMMDESDTKPTKDGAGTYLQCRFNIMDGQFRGRKVWCRLNIRNSNAQAQEIALRQLSAIGHAVKVLHIQDSQQLHGIPLKVKVKIRKGDDNYEDQNEIIAYRDINEVVDMGGAAPAGTTAGGFTPPAQVPQGFAPQAQPQGFPQTAQPAAQPMTQMPTEQPAQPPAQPWAQPAMQAMQPAQDPSNPFNTQPPAQPAAQAQPAAEPAAVQQPWNGGAAPAQAAGMPAQAAAPAEDPALAAQVAQAQAATPPWANQG